MNKNSSGKGFSLNCVQLQEYQPNRFPFLMIDHVDEVIPGISAKGYKNLTLNEWFFPNHFPKAPNMPGALQLEALAQMLTITITTLPKLKGKVIHGLKHTVRFKKEIFPGDKMIIETSLTSWNRGIGIGTGLAYTNGEVACQAEMMISVPDLLKKYLPKK